MNIFARYLAHVLLKKPVEGNTVSHSVPSYSWALGNTWVLKRRFGGYLSLETGGIITGFTLRTQEMRNPPTLLSLSLVVGASVAAGAGAGWHFVQNGTSGVLALEAIIVSPTLAIFFDFASNDPLTINGHPAWGALWDLETNTATPLDVLSDTFCASGALLSNGTMVSCILYHYTVSSHGPLL